MKTMILPALAMFIAALCADAAQPARPTHQRQAAPPAIVLATIPDSTGEIVFEQFADGLVVMIERSLDAASRLDALGRLAKSQGIPLCPAQVFGMFSAAPIPDVLFARCTDPRRVRADLDTLRVAAKVFRIFDGSIDPRPGFCNGINDDAAQFRTIECAAEQNDLYGDSFYDADNVFWCSNSLRSSSDRIMSQMLNNEGEVASTRMVSCGGTTRFRFYKRDSTGDAWNLYRDYDIGANEYFTLYSYDSDSYGDSDFRFRLTSDAGASHRNTGYFIDD